MMSRRRRPRRAIRVPVASMGDIAFLLIIFFILCSNFIKDAPVSLDPPRAADLRPVKESTILVSIDADGRVYLQGAEVPNAEAVEWGVAAILQARPAAADTRVLFKCDRGVDKTVFEPVLDAITKGGGLIVAVGQRRE